MEVLKRYLKNQVVIQSTFSSNNQFRDIFTTKSQAMTRDSRARNEDITETLLSKARNHLRELATSLSVLMLNDSWVLIKNISLAVTRLSHNLLYVVYL